MTRARAAVLVLAGLTLAACGTIHGQSISMKALDRNAAVYCIFAARAAAQQGAQSPSNSEVRRQAVTTLVSLVVARQIAEDKGLTPRPGSYTLTPAQERQIAKAFPDGDTDQIKQVIEDSQELSEIAVALGERSTGQQRTSANESQLAQTGQAQITQALADHDVEFAPRFGLSDTTKPVSDTGSLSVASAESGNDKTAPLQASQRCS
jgi:hypothetical protein